MQIYLSKLKEFIMKCHEVDYKIIGDDMQIVEVELDPSETVIAEAGAMNYLQPEITFETKMGDGSSPEKGLLDKVFSETRIVCPYTSSIIS